MIDRFPSTHAVSEAEKKLRQLDRRDSAMRIFEVFVLFGLIAFAVLAFLKLDTIAQTSQDSIKSGEISNKQVHDEIKSYIKCVLLIPRASDEPFTEQQLDSCAESVSNKQGVLR